MSTPSREELLENGGLYPVIVPLGWTVVGQRGEQIPIPSVRGDPFHKILALGPIIAKEPAGESSPELVVLREYPLPNRLISEVLSSYARLVVDLFARTGLQPKLVEKVVLDCALSPDLCGKIIVDRFAPGDGRRDVRYLLRDIAGRSWELTYIVRRTSQDTWAPLFAELERPRGGGLH